MSNDDPAAAQRAARMRQEAERRLIVHATMQAKRAGRLPKGERGSTGSEIVTAIVVLVVVIGMLAMIMRQAG
jgi:hypothetical protein